MIGIRFLWISLSVCLGVAKPTSIHDNTGVKFLATSYTFEPTISMSADFTVSFDKASCCPYLLLLTSTAAQAFQNKTCVRNENQILSKFSKHSNAVIELKLPTVQTTIQDLNSAQCEDTGDGHYSCTGSLSGVTHSPNTWSVVVAFECNERLPARFGHDVTFRSGPETGCQPYQPFFPKCDELNLHEVHVPNIFGAPTQGHIEGILGLISNAVYSLCHKHLGEYFCRGQFQSCNSTDLPGNKNYQGYPCRETCQQVHHQCSKEVADQLEFDICLWYPSVNDNITCFSIDVTCDEPQAPSHGSVEVKGLLAGSKAVYDCHVFFDFYGDRVRTCQASGMWSGVEPRCDEFSRTAKITFSVIAIVMVMIVTMSIACVLKAKTIKVLLFIKCNWSFGRRLEIHGRDHDVFVVYHHDGPDVDLVLQELLPLLDQYDITAATEDCFELGKDKFSELQNTITQSRSALIVITAEFLKEKWKLYQLNQAVCTEIAQSNFKVVFLLCQELTKLGELPENLLLFLRVGATVEQYKRGWEGRLVYELKHRTKKSLSQRISSGRQSFDVRHAVYEIDVPEQPEQEVHYVNVDVQPEGHYINIEEQPEGLYVNVDVNTA